MADGKLDTGGLCDRLRAIVSLYKLCKEKKLNFKINFIHPFTLSDYLIPNEYDWIINPVDISYKLNFARPIYFHHSLSELSKYIALNNIKKSFQQIHFYTNARFADDQYSVLINELFKPTGVLQKKIDYHKKQIGTHYIAAGFRFVTLLNDYFHKNHDSILYNKTLPNTEKELLLLQCVEQLNKLYLESNLKIFVLSDSITFLNRIKDIPFIYYIPGDVKDISQVDTLDNDIITKIFLDYYMAGQSQKVYTLVNGDMYRSGFHYYAALHNNVPYEIRDF
jgi:hypothetical protein